MRRDRLRRHDSPCSVFPQEHPCALGHGWLPDILRNDLGVPDPGDRRADRRKYRRAIGVLLLALDLAERLDPVGPARPGAGDLLQLGGVELETELLTGERRDAGGERAARRATGERAGL